MAATADRHQTALARQHEALRRAAQAVLDASCFEDDVQARMALRRLVDEKPAEAPKPTRKRSA